MKAYATVALILLLPAFSESQSKAGTSTRASDDAALAAPVPADQQPSKEDLMKLFEVMHVRQQIENIRKTMQQMLQQQLAEQSKTLDAKYPKVTPEQQAEIQKLLDKYIERSINIYPIDDVLADIIPAYQRHFTKDDVKSLTEFYGTPAGQRRLALQPIIMKEYTPIVVTRINENTLKLTQEFSSELEAYVTKSIAPAAAPALQYHVYP